MVILNYEKWIEFYILYIYIYCYVWINAKLAQGTCNLLLGEQISLKKYNYIQLNSPVIHKVREENDNENDLRVNWKRKRGEWADYFFYFRSLIFSFFPFFFSYSTFTFFRSFDLLERSIWERWTAYGLMYSKILPRRAKSAR